MTLRRTACLVSVGTLLTVGSTLAGDDVRVLGGVGSLRRPIGDGTTWTLQGLPTKADDALAVCFRWKAWRYGYAAYAPIYPPVVYAAPVDMTPSYSLPPPTVVPPSGSSYDYQPLPPAAEPATRSRSDGPTIVFGYQGRLFGGAITLRPGTRMAATSLPRPPRAETAPAPRPSDSFRYDGGPANPVPMPTPDVLPPTDPVPTTVPALHRVTWQQSRAKLNYLSFGERTGYRSTDPLLVKRTLDR